MTKRKSKEKENFIFHSNMIEEIAFPLTAYKDGENSEYPEIAGHSRAYDYMIEHCREPLSEKHILYTHGLLTEHLLNPQYRGQYRDCAVYIGGHEGSHPIAIRPLMEELVKRAAEAKFEKHCWAIHDWFEQIHPFVDGNGRTGRLILNWVRLHLGFKLYTVLFSDRWKYYKKIDQRERLEMPE